jgi:hypothetical protein
MDHNKYAEIEYDEEQDLVQRTHLSGELGRRERHRLSRNMYAVKCGNFTLCVKGVKAEK